MELLGHRSYISLCRDHLWKQMSFKGPQCQEAGFLGWQTPRNSFNGTPPCHLSKTWKEGLV